MSVFGDYSRYYDLLYRDKDYEAEVAYIVALIEQYAPGAKTILELGCGTGKHATLLAARGYEVVGVDMSADMLLAAQTRQGQLDASIAARLQLEAGDVRSVRLGKQFDVVISLFHVISYQTTNSDLQATFETVGKHLNAGGVFIFDYWYGPAVLYQQPSVRIKRLEDEQIRVVRVAEPKLNYNTNTVLVNYQVFIENKVSGAYSQLQESHLMRYLFLPELALAQGDSFGNVAEFGWLGFDAPSARDWGVVSVWRR